MNEKINTTNGPKLSQGSPAFSVYRACAIWIIEIAPFLACVIRILNALHGL